MYLFFSFFLDTLSFCTLVLWPLSHSKYCIYPWYIFDDAVITFHISLHVLFLFSLYTHVSYFLYAILYFYFTLRCLDEFLFNVFQKDRLSNLSCHELSSCKVFQEFVLGLDFIVFNKWVWVEWFMTSLIFHLFVVILSRIPNGEIVKNIFCVIG